MLRTIERIDFKTRRKAEVLKREGSSIIVKTPMIVTSKDGKSGISIDITKTAGAFHGQIARDANGGADLVAEMAKHPDALWIRVKAIEADAPNDNGDYFSREEIIKSYHTFEGCPVFTNHENSKVENAKGKVVKAEWDDREGAVYCTMYIDRAAQGALCRAIEEGYVTDVSMGTQVDYSTCSVCEKKAFTADDYCDHVKTMKGRNIEGSKVFEKNYGLKFIEISVVTDGACKECTIQQIIDPNEFLTRVANAVSSVNGIKLAYNKDAFKKEAFTKDGGQAEIQKLNQAMDLLEDVSRTMLDQRQFIDMEFAQKVVEVLANLQHVNDELVDQGYGRIGDQGMAQQQTQMGIPPMPENSAGPKQEQGGAGANPFLTGPSATGVGSVTEPATASSGGKTFVSAQSRIKDLLEQAKKIYEEARLSSGGDSVDKDKANQTIAKLATFWQNPSVRKFVTEVDDGDFKVIVGSDEIIGLHKTSGKKIASLKVANLDSDVQEELKKNPTLCAGYLIDSLKSSFASMSKTAGYEPVDEKNQHESTMERQLETERVPLHPRTDEVRVSITEDQLRNKRDGYDYHERTETVRDSITEKQLRDGTYQGYDYFKVQDKPRDEIMELQLRNKGWKGNETPADKASYAAGVEDQKQQITEGQLNDWKGADKRFLPTDRITEKQLAEDSENWGRRIASKEDAKKAVTAGFSALANTAIATGATPDELLATIADFSSSPRNMIAAERAVESLSSLKEIRQAMLARSKFHGAKVASRSEVADYLLGAMADQGMVGEVALATLDTISSQKNAVKQISDAIVASKTEQKPAKTASSKDFLREALADSENEEIIVSLEKTAIKADEKDADAFKAAAFEAAIKVAEAEGHSISEKVSVAEKDGKVSVAMLGKKEAKKGDFGGKKAPPFGAGGKAVKKEDDKEEDEKPDLEARKQARKEVVAQFGGAAPGGDAAGGAPGGMPGPGGGTTMPAAPGAGGDPTAGVPPVAGLGAGAAGEEEGPGEGEAVPPGTICPVCGSDNVDVRHGEFTCNDCGGAGEIEVVIKVKEWPNVIEDTEPKEEGLEGGAEEGGIGEMGGGAGMEMGGAGAPPAAPGVGMQAAFKITPEMVKLAGGKPVGSYCPHCGSGKVKLALKKGCGNCECGNCGGTYEVETLVDTANKTLLAKIRWEDRKIAKLAAQRLQAHKKAIKAARELASKKASLEQALKKEGLMGKFAKADLAGKANIIATLADKKLLKKAS